MLARIQKSMKEKDQGFTLIELLVVMIIIGILAAVAIPVFLNQKKKASDTAIKSDLTNFAQQIESDAVDSNSYSGSTTWVTLPYAAAAAGSTAAVSIASGQKASDGDTIQYRLNTDSNYFCLRGSNPKSNAVGGSNGNFFFYTSKDGGLVTTASTTYPSGC